MGLSPDGKWALYLKGGRVYSYEMATGKQTVIDGGRSFVNAEDDHDYERPVYGVAGFTTDGKALLYDRYDVWALPLAGGPITNLTKGEGAKNARCATASRSSDAAAAADAAVAAAAAPRRSRSI